MRNIRLIILLSALCGTCTSVVAQNMISNGDFESDFTYWQNIVSSSATATYSVTTTSGEYHGGAKAMKVVITKAGTNAYDIQSIHAGWAAVSGTSYTLTLWAKASASGLTMKLVNQNANYAESTKTLTTSYAQYSWTFTASENGTKFRLNFPVAGTFYVDDIVINDPNAAAAPANTTLTITPATTYQTMEGFGGAMTWYSNWLMYGSQSNRDNLYQYIFKDLGLDILRLKNWYFPTNYPTDKGTTALTDNNSYNATVEFFKKAKATDPTIDVLLCSWTPPPSMKSNSAANAGTLKKNGSGVFMYSELAQYYEDMIGALKKDSVKPDFFSFQNEPGYQNTGWETCEWRPTESTDYPAYGTAFDSIYNRLKKQTTAPKMIGPEVENIGTDADLSNANTFTSYTDPIKTKSGLFAYAYHIYNFGGSNEANIMSSATATSLNVVKGYSDKQNFMTEFGSLNWYDDALMIQQTLKEANASAYIKWELVWQDNDYTCVSVTNTGAYTIKPAYYSLKHFSKWIDKGYQRISLTTNNSYVNATAFKNPSKNQITIVAINRSATSTSASFNLGSYTVSGLQAFQSVSGNYYQTLSGLTSTSNVALPGQSITTIVVDYIDPSVNLAPTVSITEPANNATYVATASITLTATAADTDGTISKVEFYNGSSLLGTATTSPYTFTWTNVGVGTYTITAKATDNKSSSTVSPAITVVVNANQLPTAGFTSPDTVFLVNASSYTVTATATDNDGTISTVELYSNSVKVSDLTGSASNYTGTLAISPGIYTICVVATDNNGGQTTSKNIVLVDYARQTIDLTAGWNLISTYLTPRGTPIDTVFASIKDSLITVKTSDAFYDPAQDVHFNSLTDIAGSTAYLVKMKYATELIIVGMPIASYSTNLVYGWNMLGIPVSSTTDISTALSNVTSSVNSVKNFDGFWKPGSSTSSIQQFEPGKGYFIYMNAASSTVNW